MTTSTTLASVSRGGKTWRSLDLTQQSNANSISNCWGATAAAAAAQTTTHFLTIAHHGASISPHASNTNLHSPNANPSLVLSTSPCSSSGSSGYSGPSGGLLTINCNTPSPHSPSGSLAAGHHHHHHPQQQQMLTPNSHPTQLSSSPSHYYHQLPPNPRIDFKNRRSSSEPVQEMVPVAVNNAFTHPQQQHATHSSHHQHEDAHQVHVQAHHPNVVVVHHHHNPSHSSPSIDLRNSIDTTTVKVSDDFDKRTIPYHTVILY